MYYSLETFLLVVHVSYTILFHRKKTKKMYQKSVNENLFLLFEVIAREHVCTQATLVREYVGTKDTMAREQARHVSTQGTLAREHVKCKIIVSKRLILRLKNEKLFIIIIFVLFYISSTIHINYFC